jgi:hypothetical protein
MILVRLILNLDKQQMKILEQFQNFDVYYFYLIKLNFKNGWLIIINKVYIFILV